MNNESTQDKSVVVLSTGERLRRAREKMGFTQQEVAERLCLKISTICDIEEDKSPADLSLTFLRGYMRSYARLVNVPVSELFTSQLEKQIFIENIKNQRIQNIALINLNRKRDICLMILTWFIILIVIFSISSWWWQKNNLSQNHTVDLYNKNNNIAAKEDDDILINNNKTDLNDEKRKNNTTITSPENDDVSDEKRKNNTTITSPENDDVSDEKRKNNTTITSPENDDVVYFSSIERKFYDSNNQIILKSNL